MDREKLVFNSFMNYFLWFTCGLLPCCLGYQTSVKIDKPCTDNQQYKLGRDDALYIAATGNNFIDRSCAISLRAEDKVYQCSKICLTIDSFNLQTCDLQLSYYDTGVWNFGSAKPSYKATCNGKPAVTDWCSTGPTATVRLENIHGLYAAMVGKYGFHLVAVSSCSDNTRTDPIERPVTDAGSSMNITIIIVGAVLGCVVICTCIVVFFLVWYVRRRTILFHTDQERRITQSSIPNLPESSYHPVQVEDNCNHDSMDVVCSEGENDHLMKDNIIPTENGRVWQQPTAPPVEDSGTSEDRPPSYCSTPPEYLITNGENHSALRRSSEGNDVA